MDCLHLSPNVASASDDELKVAQRLQPIHRRAGQFLLSALTPFLLSGTILVPTLVLAPVAQAQITIQRPLVRGDRGRDVLQLQQELVRRGFLDVEIPSGQRDGYFGPATEAAVKAFQRSEDGLVADGVFGQQSLFRLFGMGPIYTQAFSIAVMQAQLTELGYYRSGLDGEYGSATRRALQDLRDEAFVDLSLRENRLEQTFDTVNDYYGQQRQRRDLPHPSVLEQRVEQQVPVERLLTYGVGNSVNTGSTNRNSERPRARGFSNQTFAVIVPVNGNASLLGQVRSFVSDAYLQPSSRGDFIQVGAYGDRNNAEEMRDYLRRQGFDARLD